MKLEEVLPAYREGKTIQVKYWHCNPEYYEEITKYNKNSSRTLKNVSHIDLLGDNWEIEIEKDKVKKYPVLLQHENYYTVSLCLFSSLENAKIALDNVVRGCLVIRLITEIPELIEEVEL